jgi:hypothetical protein
MAFPSVPEVIDGVNQALVVFSEGGTKALALIFIINIFLLVGFCYLFFKFMVRFIKEHNDEKETALGAKDTLLNESRLRLENISEQYAKLLTQSIEREQMLTNEVRELKTLVTVFLTGSNNRTKNYDRDESDDHEEKKRPNRKRTQ